MMKTCQLTAAGTETSFFFKVGGSSEAELSTVLDRRRGDPQPLRHEPHHVGLLLVGDRHLVDAATILRVEPGANDMLRK